MLEAVRATLLGCVDYIRYAPGNSPWHEMDHRVRSRPRKTELGKENLRPLLSCPRKETSMRFCFTTLALGLLCATTVAQRGWAAEPSSPIPPAWSLPLETIRAMDAVRFSRTDSCSHSPTTSLNCAATVLSSATLASVYSKDQFATERQENFSRLVHPGRPVASLHWRFRLIVAISLPATAMEQFTSGI
jgi:hypothetical protein